MGFVVQRLNKWLPLVEMVDEVKVGSGFGLKTEWVPIFQFETGNVDRQNTLLNRTDRSRTEQQKEGDKIFSVVFQSVDFLFQEMFYRIRNDNNSFMKFQYGVGRIKLKSHGFTWKMRLTLSRFIYLFIHFMKSFINYEYDFITKLCK